MWKFTTYDGQKLTWPLARWAKKQTSKSNIWKNVFIEQECPRFQLKSTCTSCKSRGLPSDRKNWQKKKKSQVQNRIWHSFYGSYIVYNSKLFSQGELKLFGRNQMQDIRKYGQTSVKLNLPPTPSSRGVKTDKTRKSLSHYTEFILNNSILSRFDVKLIRTFKMCL